MRPGVLEIETSGAVRAFAFSQIGTTARQLITKSYRVRLGAEVAVALVQVGDDVVDVSAHALTGDGLVLRGAREEGAAVVLEEPVRGLGVPHEDVAVDAVAVGYYTSLYTSGRRISA